MGRREMVMGREGEEGDGDEEEKCLVIISK